jgi:hypothetical protein
VVADRRAIVDQEEQELEDFENHNMLLQHRLGLRVL